MGSKSWMELGSMKQPIIDAIVIICIVWFVGGVAKLIQRLYELS